MPWTNHVIPNSEFTEGEPSSAYGCLVVVGSTRYYVTVAEVGTTQATFRPYIQKSTDGGVTWSANLNTDTTAFSPFVICSFGSTIFIVGNNNLSELCVFHWDTATDTFSHKIVSGLITGGLLSAAVYNDGTLLISYGDIVRYDPATQTFSAPAG